MAQAEEWRAAGFDVERLAPDTLVVRSVPAMLPPRTSRRWCAT